jgi:hypothetical protein
MTSRLRFQSVLLILAAVAVLSATAPLTSAASAGACGDASYAGERSKLERVLVARSYSKAERSFLLGGADRRVRELKRNALNERGRRCGIEAVRAHVLGCVAAQLPRAPSPDRKTGKAMWGKTNVVGREAVFIGSFHACRGAALETLFDTAS